MTSQITIEQLVRGLDGVQVVRGPGQAVSSITYDSRSATEGAMFVALRGSYADGHGFLQAARALGATSCLIDRDVDHADLDGYRAVAKVDDTRRALAEISRRFYGDPSRELTLIGITGTDGKTTTSFLTAQLLRRAGLSVGLIGTIGIQIPGQPMRSAGRQTTPESLDTQRLLAEMRDAAADVVILETSSHGLETHRVEGCSFDIGLITNITHEHLDFHGSLAAYQRAKARLFDRVAASQAFGGKGIAIVNQDDPGARTAIPKARGLRLVRYGMDSGSDLDVAATNVAPEASGFRFYLRINGEQRPAGIPLPGTWNVSNALAAAGICHSLGLPISDIADGLRDLQPVPGRMQPILAGQPFQVIVDYAHTAPALSAILRSMRETTKGRILVLFGSAGERDIEKRAGMGAVAVQGSDYALISSEDPRFEDPEAIIDEIARGATEAGGIERVDFDRQEDRRMAIECILKRAAPGDTVILAGKGHERSMIYGDDQLPWDEAGIAGEVLASMGYITKV